MPQLTQQELIAIEEDEKHLDRIQSAKNKIMAMRNKELLQQDLLATILQWHKDVCPTPTASDIYVGTACMYEEMAEFCESQGAKSLAENLMQKATTNYNNAEKTADPAKSITAIDKKAHLDSLCDIIVVAIQDGYRHGYDIIGALAEVVRSNESKRLDDGTFPRNDAGKVIKTSPNYFNADVSPFVG